MKTVLITGGSSGIGYEMSRHFTQDGYRLLWIAKPPDELRHARAKLAMEINGVDIHTLAIDLSEQKAAQEAYAWAKHIERVDVLINNAGFGTHGWVQHISLEQELAMIHLNVITLYQLTRFFLNDMLERDAGTIINISSNAAFQPVARMNTYASAKAFVQHFSRGLQEELSLQKSRVKVLTVCPAAIKDTSFSQEMQRVRTFHGMTPTTAKEVARDVWKAFKKGKTFQVTGTRMRILHAMRRLTPYALQQYLVRRETEIEN
jgi:uncharacterized protein